MTELADRLDDLVDAVSERGSLISTYLQPGRSRRELRDLFAAAGADPHESVYELFEWHDGVDMNRLLAEGTPEPFLMHYFEFEPIIDALQQYGRARHRNTVPGVWPSSWFSAFAGPCGDLIAVSNTPDDRPGSIWRVWWESDHEYLFDSLSDLVETVRFGFESGALVVEAEGWVSTTDPLWEA